MHDFTPVHALFGGVLIALSLAINLVATGRIAGLSGIISGLVIPSDGRRWRMWYVAGVLAVALAFQLAAPATFDQAARVPLWVVALAGALVGYGTRACNGCTSGHGLCGMSRLSIRSIVATVTFFAFGIIAATLTGCLVRHL